MAHIDSASLYRLTGERGLALWAYVTSDPAAEVLSEGYFEPVAGLLGRYDRIMTTTDAESGEPWHAMLVVKESHRDRGVSVAALSAVHG